MLVHKDGRPCSTCGSTLRYSKSGACVLCAKRRSTEAAVKRCRGVWKHRLSEHNLETMTAKCAACGIIALKTKTGKLRCPGSIKEHRGIRKQSVEAQKLYRERTKRPRKEGPCDICKLDTKLCWDHDHITGLHRGWLCHHCNVGIGFLKDSVKNLQAAIEYLNGVS
jgi:uncharacterized Zn finger protein (UPF0148 family)